MKRATIAFALGVALFTGRASAEPPPPSEERVVVLVYGANDTFGIRLEAELRSIGLKVVRRRHASRNQPQGTIAVVTVTQRGDRRVEIRMGSDPFDQKAADIVVSVDDLGDDLESIQAAERVRATFEPLAPRPTAGTTQPAVIVEDVPQPPSPSPSPPLPPMPPPAVVLPESPPQIVINVALPPPERVPSLPPLLPRDQGWAFGFSASAGSLFGSQGPSVEGTVSFVASPFEGLRFEPFVMVPLVPLTLHAGDNQADLYAGAIGLRASYSVLRAEPFELALGGGFEALWVRAVGSAGAGYVGTTDDAFTGGALFDVMPRFRLHDVVSLVPRATVGLAFAPIETVFDGYRVSTWGLPFGEASLGVELMWGSR